MKPKITVNLATYIILSLAGAGSFVLPGDITMPAAVALHDASPEELRLVPTVHDLAGSRPGFRLTGGRIVPARPYAAHVTVISAAIPLHKITARVKIGSTLCEPFGPYDDAVAGNLNDDDGPRSHVFPSLNTIPAGTPLSIEGASWQTAGGNGWALRASVDSAEGSPVCRVLVDGDPAPDLDAASGRTAAGQFLADAIDSCNDTIMLQPDEVLYLLELNTTDLDSPAADFLDLVILVTLTYD